MRLSHAVGLLFTLGVFVFALSCGGGGGKLSSPITPPANSVGGGAVQPSATELAKELQGTYLTEAPRTEIDPNYVLVKTGDEPDEFQKVATKYGCQVEGKSGNWITLRVPDGNLEHTIAELKKEYTVFDVQPLRRYIMPRDPDVFEPNVRVANYLPFDSLYADRALFPVGYDQNQNIQYSSFYAQRVYMAPMGFEGAWDVAIRAGVRDTSVVVAVIDAGIYRDPGTGDLHPDFDTNRVAPGSGTIAGDGTFTPDVYFWEVDAQGNPYRATGNKLVGLFASARNNIINWITQVGDPPLEAQFTASLTPLTPFADVMIIKTGSLSGGNWTFSDAHIANSINHAVANGANIILLGMWAEGPVSPVVQDAITNARNNDVLVIAPGGMSQLDTSDPDPNNWTWGTPGSVSNVTPAAADGVVSVMGTGFEQIDLDEVTLPLGYANLIIPNIGDAWNEVASFSYTGGDIAAVGWGTSWSYNFFNVGINVNTSPAAPGNVDIAYAAAYVAAASAIAYQALTNANGGTPPADVDTIIENLLISEALVLPSGVPFLSAGSVAHVANNGGYNQVIQAVDITSIQLSGAVFVNPTWFVETNSEFQVSVSMMSSAGGYLLAVDWGDGTTTPPDGVPAPYNPGDPISHTYTTAGSRVIYFLARDADGYTDFVGIPVVVYDGLSVNMQIQKQDLSTVSPDAQGRVPLDYETEPGVSAVYIINANAQFREITGNVITTDWDFDYTGNPNEFDPEVTGEERFVLLFSYGPPPPNYTGPITYLNKDSGTEYTIGLRVTQTKRPTVIYELRVIVGSPL